MVVAPGADASERGTPVIRPSGAEEGKDMLRRLGIRSKVLAVLAVPMLVVLLAGVFISFEAIRDLRDSRTARQVVDLVATYVPLNDALNAERVA